MDETYKTGKAAFAAGEYGKEKDYWLNTFDGEFKKVQFPFDGIPEGNRRMETLEIVLPHPLFLKLSELGKGKDHRLFMLLLAGLKALLYKYTGETDIILGTTIFRQEEGGDYINTVLPLRTRLDENSSFKDLVMNRVRKTVMEAVDHQNYPVETLVYQLGLDMTGREFPLFDVALLLENIHDPSYLDHIPYNVLFALNRTQSAMKMSIRYRSGCFKPDTIQRIAGHFILLMEQVTADLDLPLNRIGLLSTGEKQKLLERFSGSRIDYPRDKTIDRLFEEQTTKTPAAVAFSYEGEQFTYELLNTQADRLAGCLKSAGLVSGEPVALMVNDSHRVLAAVLGILKAGGGYLPVNTSYPPERRGYILKDCAVRFLLTNLQFDSHVPVEHIYHLDDPDIYSFSPPERKEHHARSLAYIMYTSGSTGTPKGVMVEHRAVIRLVKNTSYVEFNPCGAIMLTGALEFDASTFEIWGALLNGLTLHLVSKDTIISHRALKQALRRNRVTTIWMTAPLFNQMLDAGTEMFGGLKNLLVGGDVLSPNHINRLRKRFPALRVINGYGPTENTTFSTTFTIDKEYEQNIPIGKPIGNSSAYILDARYQPVPIGVPGQLYVGGDGLARGYLNNPELTAERFASYKLQNTNYEQEPAASNTLKPGGVRPRENRTSACLYETGDLARWREDGNILFLGRLDQQVKIRGFRVEPGEIETRLAGLDSIKEAVVTVNNLGNNLGGNEKYLCAYVVSADGNSLDLTVLKQTLTERLPDFMVPAYFVRLPSIPLTPNGKIDRRALPQPQTMGGTPYAAPRNEMEKEFVRIWALVLGLEEDQIGIDHDFFEMGGHSLKATILISKLHNAFDVKLPLSELFRTPTIRELAQFISQLKKEKFASINAAEDREYYPLSSAQERLYVLHQVELSGTNYNVPYNITLEGELDPDKTEKIMRQLIQRHESLRTSFQLVDEKPVQVIHDNVDFGIQYFESAGHPEAASLRDFVRPFDLSSAPLLRLRIVRLKESEYTVMLDMHHIITDGTSMDLLVKEFMTLYAGGNLPQLKLQYRDYSQWQNSPAQREALKDMESFWVSRFEDEIPVLQLPLDYPRPAIQSFEGETLSFGLPADLTQAVRDLVANTGATLFIMLLSVYTILLSKISGQQDIVVGSPIAGRRHVDLENIIGMFVNTLALRNFPRGHLSFVQFLKEVKKSTLQAFENQEFQFEDLVELAAVNRDAGRNPLFDAVLSLQNMEAQTPEMKPVDMTGIRLKPSEKQSQAAKFDLTFTFLEAGDNIFCTINYCSKLFKPRTIERIRDYFSTVCQSVAEDPAISLSAIHIISPEEKQRVLHEFNGACIPYDSEKTIHQAFSEQAQKTPQRAAVKGPHQTDESELTYRQLDHRSGRLAVRLREQGAASGAIVAIKMDRSIDLIIAILAVLKADAAYLPIDTGYPRKRVNYILADSGACTVLSAPLESSTFSAEAGEPILGSGDAAYVIYTSGSTGRPKGVLAPHKGIINMADFHWNTFGEGEQRRFSQVSSPSFDAMCLEMWPCLLKGGTLCIVPEDVRLEADILKDWLLEQRITVSFQSTAMAQRLLDQRWPERDTALQALLTGGDRLTRYPARPYPFRFFNLYGLTETTVYSTCHEVPVSGQSSEVPPIGKPIPNHLVTILGPNNELQPPGVPGEIHIGGAGLALGYLNNPELTAELFLPAQPGHGAIPSHRSYKTGDLARWTEDGNIHFLGRTGNQVKIRGYRIELGEIESRLMEHENVSEAVVVVRRDKTGTGALCAYLVSDEADLNLTVLKEHLSQTLPAYMAPAFITLLEKMPLTSSGKINRRALPGPVFQSNEAYAAPRDEIERGLARIWSEVLGLDGGASIGVNDNFFQLGGQSLSATGMTAKIHKEFDVRLPLGEVFKTPNIRELAETIRKMKKERFTAIPAVEKKEYYPLSPAQKRLYIIQQMEPAGTAYNVTGAYPLKPEMADAEKLNRVISRLINRHESLRTSFEEVNGRTVQRVHDRVEFRLETQSAAAPGHSFVRPFQLSCAPLLRAALSEAPGNRFVLMMDMHHIISDGISQTILIHDFITLYKGDDLAPLPLQYKDFAVWQNGPAAASRLEEQQRYWLNMFETAPPQLRLPLDFPRPQTRTFEGCSTSYPLDRELAGGLTRMAADQGVTLFILFLTLFKLLVGRLSGQDDIVVATAAAGRNHADMERIIGMFVNTLALRSRPEKDKTLLGYMEEIKTLAVDAFDNQDYPFEDLVDKVAHGHDVNRNPLFDVFFTFDEAEPGPVGEDAGSSPAETKHEPAGAKFDITFNVTKRGERLVCTFRYASRLFKSQTIDRLFQVFRSLAQTFLNNPELTISQLSVQLTSQSEKEAILADSSIDLEDE